MYDAKRFDPNVMEVKLNCSIDSVLESTRSNSNWYKIFGLGNIILLKSEEFLRAPDVAERSILDANQQITSIRDACGEANLTQRPSNRQQLRW